MSKQQTIQYLNDLMSVIQNAYYKRGMFMPLEFDSNSGVCGNLRVHECDNASISIDLYNFEGDGKPVCDGLKPCTITFDDGSHDIGHLYCMHYNHDDVTPLVFLFSHDKYGDGGDIDVEPESIPADVLENIAAWLEKAMQPEPPVPTETAKDIIALWTDWCMDYDDENLWLDYMVKHPKAHCNRRHLQEKWDYCYNKYGNKAAMNMFWRELDNDNRAILTEYITTQWHKN